MYLTKLTTGLLLLLSTSLAFAAPSAPPSSSPSSPSSASTVPSASTPPTLQRTCGPSKLSVCCVVAGNSSTTTTTTASSSSTTTTRSLPSPVRGQSDDDENDGAGEFEGEGRNETTFDVTPVTVHSCRLKEAGVECDDLATAACCRVIHVPIGAPEFMD
ncbi:hypothetical protein D0862_14025 [Hortaea werneckii]|uniref:Hydrophobin n=1 Tax=Hortaea werneckii TaxID=91943 RepID=A0A3M7EE57_HORWE|nr:hypothetical protein D0862_14025 [Hortaea werneckii]